MVSNYQRFAKHWSIRSKLGDPTLEIMVAAIVDERAFSVIDDDLCLRHGKSIRATVAGLRDYAARSGIVTGRVAAIWMERAETIFPIVHPDLSLAQASARLEFMKI